MYLPQVRRALFALAVCHALSTASPLAHAQPQPPKDPGAIEAEISGQSPAPPAPPAPEATSAPEQVVAPKVENAPPSGSAVELLPAPAEAPAVSELRDYEVLRLREIEAELTTVRDDIAKARIGLPLTGMIVGYAGAALLGAVALTNAIEASGVSPIGLGIGAGVMFGVGIGSHLRLRSRVTERRALHQRLLLLSLEQLTLKGSEVDRSSARTRFARLAIVHRELGELREEHAKHGLAAPIVTMVAGFAVSIPLFAMGAVADAFGADGGPFVTGGLVSLAVGGAGALWLGYRRRQRKPFAHRIRELQAEERGLAPISFNVKVERRSANLTLQLRF